MLKVGEHITDIYITEAGTTELENLSHNIIDIFIILSAWLHIINGMSKMASP